MTITMMALALALTLQQQPATDAPLDGGLSQEEQPTQGVPAAPAVQAYPSAPPGKKEIKRAARRIEDMGDTYEELGRCAGAMPAEVVEAVLRQAQQQPQLGPYLLARYEKGFRHPMGQRQCDRRLGTAEAGEAP